MSVSSSTKPAPGSLASPTTSTRPSIPPLATDVKAANGRKSSPPPTPSAQAKADQTTVAKDASSKDNAKEATDAKVRIIIIAELLELMAPSHSPNSRRHLRLQ